MTKRHKVFISYYHKDDERRRKKFEQMCVHNNIMVNRSIQPDDIPPTEPVEVIIRRIREDFISDATVTIVLVGAGTWRRKYVDWEIYASLRHTAANPRNGLIGIILPNHPDFNKTVVNLKTIPPRLADNVEKGYAQLHHWTGDMKKLKSWIHQAFKDRTNPRKLPNNSRERFAKNRSMSEQKWQ